ncbi:dTDP-4-dehydrorhamnose 3,5-epimerase family protein [Streptomyces sp. NPDC002690]
MGFQVERTGIEGALRVRGALHEDDRGAFREIHSARWSGATGRQFVPAQTNVSVSRRGALRGIAYSEVPPGQAKVVTCLTGAVLDVVVDLRVGSPTFGEWRMHELREDTGVSVLIEEGLGHAFVALADQTTMLYLLSSPHNPGREHSVNALDPGLAIAWPTGLPAIRSERDLAAPGLHEAAAAGLLPHFVPSR